MKKFNLYLCKIDRIAAWVLLGVMIAYFISGYGMTKGIFDTGIAVKIHNNILPLVAIVAFVVHTFYAIRLAFRRWNIWDGLGKYFLIFLYAFLVSGFVYLDFFYQKTEKNVETTEAVETVQETNDTGNLNTETTENEAVSEEPKEKTFTIEELAQYDGKDGKPAYVAVDGIVYDMSSVFDSGKHYSHYAGKELTTAFYSYHVKSQITKYPVIGVLE